MNDTQKVGGRYEHDINRRKTSLESADSQTSCMFLTSCGPCSQSFVQYHDIVMLSSPSSDQLAAKIDISQEGF